MLFSTATATLTVRWTSPVGYSVGAAMAGGTVFLGGADVTALDEATRKVQWTGPAPTRLDATDGSLVTEGRNGPAPSALDATTGTVLNTFSTDLNPAGNPIAIADGRIYYRSVTGFVALAPMQPPGRTMGWCTTSPPAGPSRHGPSGRTPCTPPAVAAPSHTRSQRTVYGRADRRALRVDSCCAPSPDSAGLILAIVVLNQVEPSPLGDARKTECGPGGRAVAVGAASLPLTGSVRSDDRGSDGEGRRP